ncbi:MAG: phage tail protein [Paenirhodobacter sp.]|uniref:phage tail protein n=1 Tax=Paenirhodobacter sp. TaxID=1965326 RepID=UPI003D10484D
MTKVMMMLGPYPFMLDTAAYQQLRRSTSYRWAEQARIGRKPAQQYVGAGSDEITLEGEILPHWKGGYSQVALMRAQGAIGKPLILLEGYGGVVLGQYVITKIDETKSELLADGAPRLINFSVTLKEYGADNGGLGALSTGLAALSALARLV